MGLSYRLVYLSILIFIGIGFSSCQKLDKDGGYYDEQSQTYKYVRITNKGVKKSSLQVVSPEPGKTQQIYGIVTRIDTDAKSFWLKIEDRQPYMILAERLSGGNRDDKNKELQIELKYVSPLGSVIRKGDFREKWRAHVIEMLNNQMLNKQVLVEIEYEEQARKLWGVCFTVIKTDEGDRARNVNLWMIQQGLSYYFINRGKANNDKMFRDAQEFAKQYNYGLWKYQ